jgi:hypothetical protein
MANSYDIVPRQGSDPLEQLLAAESRDEYRWDIELEADSPTQTRNEFVRANAQRRANQLKDVSHD